MQTLTESLPLQHTIDKDSSLEGSQLRTFARLEDVGWTWLGPAVNRDSERCSRWQA